MIENSIRRTPRPQDVIGMSTQQLRDTFQISGLFIPGEITGHFTDIDRLFVGGAMPAGQMVELPNHKETGRAYFLERRELGAINTGGAGVVHADGQSFELDKLDCVYLPMGVQSVTFESRDAQNPAKFYFLSCPAHTAHPATRMKSADATPVALGTQEAANKRTIYKFIHQGGLQSCQLVMGLTALGEPQQSRHLFMHNDEVALSPNWSMHFGCGAGNYKFIWGMAGENQVFDDMDPAKPLELR